MIVRYSHVLAKPMEAFGNRFTFKYHISSSNGWQSERVNPIMEDTLRACVLDFKESCMLALAISGVLVQQ